MTRRADVARIEAPLDKVWAGLLLHRDERSGGIVRAQGNPGDIGSVIVRRRRGGTVMTEVMESAPKHYVRYRQRFTGLLPRLAFLRGSVEADYEVKGSRTTDSTYMRAVVEYETPMWPTAAALLLALLSLIGLNDATPSRVLLWTVPVAVFVAAGIALQYVPRILAHRYVTKPVLDRLEDQARSGDFHESVTWNPSNDDAWTGTLDLRASSGSTPHTAGDLTQSIPKVGHPPG